jgi:hypothetical protein
VLGEMPDIVRIDRLKIFLDSMGGGAWPFLVGGVICLVNRNIARKMRRVLYTHSVHSGPHAQVDQKNCDHYGTSPQHH